MKNSYIVIAILLSTSMQMLFSQESLNVGREKDFNFYVGINSLIYEKNNISYISSYPDPTYRNTDSLKRHSSVGYCIGFDGVFNIVRNLDCIVGIQYYRISTSKTLYGDSLAQNGLVPGFYDYYHQTANNIEIPLSLSYSKNNISLSAGIKYVLISYPVTYCLNSSIEVFRSESVPIFNPYRRLENSFLPFVEISIKCPESSQIPIQFSCRYIFDNEPGQLISFVVKYKI